MILISPIDFHVYDNEADDEFYNDYQENYIFITVLAVPVSIITIIICIKRLLSSHQHLHPYDNSNQIDSTNNIKRENYDNVNYNHNKNKSNSLTIILE